MISDGALNKRQEISAGVAIALLAVFLGVYFYFQNSLEFEKTLSILDRYIDEHNTFVCLSLGALTLNVLWVYSVISRIFGFNKQGSRLHALTGEGNSLSADELKPVAISSIVGITSYFIFKQTLTPISLYQLPRVLSLETKSICIALGTANVAFFIFVVTQVLLRASLAKIIDRLSNNNLPDFPTLKNSLVIGALGEEEYAS